MEKLSVETKQLIMLGILSSLLSFVFSALDVLYTLYSINEMKVSASEWSQIRAYRYILTIVIVLILGTYAGRVGQKKIAAIAVALSLVNLLLFVIHPTKLFLFISLPFHAAFVSVITMNINVLVQEVPLRLQSASNTLYRATYTGLAFMGPLTLAFFAGSNQIKLIVLFMAFFALCLPGFLFYPDSPKMKVKSDESRTLHDLWIEWGKLIKNKRLIYFEILVTLIYSAFLVNYIFGPIKLIQVLQMNDQQFSYASTGAALLTMVFTLAAGFLLRKVLMHLVFLPLFLCSIGNILFGLQSNLTLCIILFITTNALNTLSYASVSIWTSKLVARNQLSLAFAFHKILIAVFGILFSILLSILQSYIGINTCMIVMGILGSLIAALLMREMKRQRGEIVVNELK